MSPRNGDAFAGQLRKRCSSEYNLVPLHHNPSQLTIPYSNCVQFPNQQSNSAVLLTEFLLTHHAPFMSESNPTPHANGIVVSTPSSAYHIPWYIHRIDQSQHLTMPVLSRHACLAILSPVTNSEIMAIDALKVDSS